jgi:hypothetical protein
MRIDIHDFKAVGAWVRKAKEEGWKRPREIVDAFGLLETELESCIGYCDICQRAIADFEVLATSRVSFIDDDRNQARSKTPHDGWIDDEKVVCAECLDKKTS